MSIIKKLDQNGSHLLAIILAVVIIGVIGFAGFRVFQSKPGGSSGSQGGKGGDSKVSWEFMGEKWESSGTAPKCEDPIAMQSPADISKATQVLYPGQQRSTGYKTHGGFRFENNPTGDVSVTIPRDSSLVKASRYIEQGEIQYFFVFTSPCGIAYRFDHLRELTPAFQAIADKLPEAKVDDSRTTPLSPAVAFKAGEKVATKVGFAKTQNASFDFGVYDLRAKNAASSDAVYAAKHSDDKEFAPYGVCWFDVLPAKDAAIVKGLPAGDQTAGKTSDYCK